MRTTRYLLALFVVVLVVGCGDDDADIEVCEPEGSCMCTDGMERDTLCVCEGGSNCSIDGDDIEFQCDGNAACGLTCGDNCLVTCPGTTSCTVSVGDDGVVSCPGTASCDITCLADCTVNISGTANAIVDCVNEAQGAVCEVTGCSLTDCGDGVSVCRQSCP